MTRVDGIGQGIEVVVSTTIAPGESYALVVESVRNIFPDFPDSTPELVASFPCGNNNITLKYEGLSLANFLGMAAQQRVLDTALDSMSKHLDDGRSKFTISRQAALAEKISFCQLGESVLGGIITIKIEGLQLAEWIEEATWHPGRDEVPRKVRDDFSMGDDGEPTTWLD